MKRYDFTTGERWGVFMAHGPRCYYGGEPIDWLSMQVDHLIPQSLAADRIKLAKVLNDLGLPNNFELNSFENWLPICGPCNRTKSTIVFEATPLIQQQLRRARDGAQRARRAAQRIVTDLELGDAVSILERAATTLDKLEDRHVEALVKALLQARPEILRQMVAARQEESRDALGVARWIPGTDAAESLFKLPLTPRLTLEILSNGARFIER